MAKKNVQNSNNVVKEPETSDSVTKSTQTVESQTAQAETLPGKGAQEELPDQQKSDSSKQKNDTKSAKLDTKAQTKAAGPKGNKTNIPVNETKEVSDKRHRIASEVFRRNSGCKVLYFSSDFVPFFSKSDAVRHGSSLVDNTIVTINRK